VLQEIYEGMNNSAHAIEISVWNDTGTPRVAIIHHPFGDRKVVATFDFRFQCEKLQAFKQALMWLLDHSDVKKEEEIIGTEQKVEIEGKVYKAQIIREV